MALAAAVKAGSVSESENAACLRRLERMSGRMTENIALAWEWMQEAQQELAAAENWAIAGAGIGCPVAQEAALKLMETLLRPAASFEFEEYLHGPTMMLNARMGGMYLLPPESSPDRARMQALADIHRGFRSPVVTVCAGKQAERSGGSLTMAAEPDDELAPFWQILPSQVMGAALPAVLGTEGKGKDIFAKIDEAVGVKCKAKE